MARPLSFSPEDKLKIAMMVFWKNGYNETSISALLEAMSINKYSLYQQFGNKESLFIHALEYYDREIFSPLIAPLTQNQNGKQAIDAYLSNFSDQLPLEQAQYGCLLVNTLLAGDALPKVLRDIAKHYTMKLNISLQENFQMAKHNGDLKLEVRDCVGFTLMTIQALLNTRKSHGMKAAQTNTEFFRQTLKNW